MITACTLSWRPVITSSPRRQSLLEDHIHNISNVTKRTKLLELCGTRWIQPHGAFDVFIVFLSVTVDVFKEYLQKETRPDANTKTSRLLHAKTTFPFLMTLVTVDRCLGCIKVSKDAKIRNRYNQVPQQSASTYIL